MTLALLTGFLFGFMAAEVIILIVLRCTNKDSKNEEFVKALVEQKDWGGARSVLEFGYSGKYIRIWRKLYREHIEESGNDKD